MDDWFSSRLFNSVEFFLDYYDEVFNWSHGLAKYIIDIRSYWWIAWVLCVQVRDTTRHQVIFCINDYKLIIKIVFGIICTVMMSKTIPGTFWS